MEALPNAEGDLLGVVLFRPTDERIEGLKSGADGDGRGRFSCWVRGERNGDGTSGPQAVKSNEPEGFYEGSHLGIGGPFTLFT